MAIVYCSCCILSAIFISDCGQFKACPEHYFSYKAQGNKLKRIKIPINEESKKILFDFILTLKNEFMVRIDKLIEENSKNKDNKNYKEKLNWVNHALNDCNSIVMTLVKKKFVALKFILSPFEYFLIQPKEQAQQYTKHHWEQTDLLELCRSVKVYGFDFNYLNFEDQECIHDWGNKTTYNQHDRLSDFYYGLLLYYIYMFEFEMAYEVCKSLKGYKEFFSYSSFQNVKECFDLFCKILKTCKTYNSLFLLFNFSNL